MTLLTRSRPAVVEAPPTVGTLCVFRGPTPWLDPARKLVTPLQYGLRMTADDGNEARFREAGMLQRSIEDLGYLCEHSPALQFSRDGLKVHKLYTETPEERYLRQVPEWFSRVQPFSSHSLDPFSDEALSTGSAGYVIDARPQGMWVSESVYDEAGEHLLPYAFPVSFDWGNGVTCNSWVPLLRANGERESLLVSWCVLAPEIAARMTPTDWRTLQRAFEGGQTGAILPDPVPPPPECPAVLESGDHWWKYIDHEIPHLRGCRVCGALRVGDRTVTIQANNIEVTTAAAPANPAAGLVRWYSTGDTASEMRSSGGTATAFGGTGAVTRAGGNATEATTTSTTNVDLQTTTVSIAAANPILFLTQVRKTTGAAAGTWVGIKINATQVVDNGAWSNALNQAGAGVYVAWIVVPTTGYAFGAHATVQGSVMAANNFFTAHGYVSARPSVTATSVISMASVDSALITAGHNQSQVYSLAGA